MSWKCSSRRSDRLFTEEGQGRGKWSQSGTFVGGWEEGTVVVTVG